MLRRILLVSIRCYRAWISPILGDCCRFEPSCSQYATLCLHHHGALRGSWLTLLRLLRCNPLFSGGIDLPPGVECEHAHLDWERIARLTAPATTDPRATRSASRNASSIPRARPAERLGVQRGDASPPPASLREH